MYTVRPCLHGGRVPRLGGLKHTCCPPLHATHLSEIVGGLSFERLLSTTNKMADKRNVLAASLIFLSLVLVPGGVLGYKRDGGVRRSLIFCTQKNTWTLYCAPKKIQDWKLFDSCFRILRELWLELRKNY